MTEQRDEEQDIHDVSELIILAPDGKSLVFPVTAVHGPVTVADVLTFVESRTAVPSAMMQLRKGCIGSVLLHDEGTVPLEQEFFEARLCGGLAGGKGGFGAMLRALAKQNTGHKTVDFGACRDLNGRRLRHVNNDIKLQKWTEARERKEEAKRRGIQLDSDDEEAFDGQGVICEWNGGSTGSELGRDRASRREERESASGRVQAAFRGMRSRKAVVQTRRQQMRSAEEQREADAEQRRHANRRVLRPALRATHGF